MTYHDSFQHTDCANKDEGAILSSNLIVTNVQERVDLPKLNDLQIL